MLSGSQYVDNVMIHADPFHSNCVALVVANQAALEAWAKKASVDHSDFGNLCSKPEACKEVLSSLNQVSNSIFLATYLLNRNRVCFFTGVCSKTLEHVLK